MSIIRVIVADDHDIVRMGIRKILENSPHISVVGEAKNGQEALRLVNEVGANVLVLDVEMPGMSGLEVTRVCKQTEAPVRILILSAHDDKEYVSEVLKCGAAGYILKDEVHNELLDSIHRVAKGEKGLVSSQVTRRY